MMDRFLGVVGFILACLFSLALTIALYAGLAWIVKLVWQS